MDLLNGENFYQANFNFIPTTPINDSFDFFGTDTKIMMLSSGSFFVFMVILIIRMVCYKLINKVLVCYPRYHYSRVVGMHVYRESYCKEFKN